MSLKYKDYYTILGVDKKASGDEIHKAYRKLARKYHPDVNKDAGAEDKFKEIGEAYEVLKDPTKRRKYDALGSNWKMGDDFGGGAGWNPAGGGMGGNMGGGFSSSGDFSDFFEFIFGNMGGGMGGSMGGFSNPGGRSSSRFGRKSNMNSRAMRGRDHEASLEITLEEAYKGGKRRVTLQTTENGPGGAIRPGSKVIDVKIPDGVYEGMKIRIPGQGGSSISGGTAGDLFLKIRFQKHDYFSVDKYDLSVDLPITPWEAALGSKVTVPTLDGKIRVTIKPGAKSGQKLKIAKKGLPNKNGGNGSLFATIQIHVPESLNKHERELFEFLGDRSAFNPRKWD